MLSWLLGSNEVRYEKYKKILEYIPRNNISVKDNIYNNYENNKLLSSFEKYVNEEKKDRYIVSLSGGVDSMVVASILCYLGKEVIGCHINYNNRSETKEEQEFLEEWCGYNNIKLYVKEINNYKRGEVKRSNYEVYTREIRFNFYKEVLEKEKLDCILLGHHKDDIVENIVSNVCRGRNLLDLAVIKDKNVINGVLMSRPMINFYKLDVYDFAHKNSIPYFKDTTPEWSVRGKYRNELEGKLEYTFGNNLKENLLGLSMQSFEWNSLIMREMIEPFLEKVIYNENGVEFNIDNYVNYPLCFWNIIFAKLFYRYGYNCPSRKGIRTFMNSIPGINKASLSDNCVCKIVNNKVNIVFINNNNVINKDVYIGLVSKRLVTIIGALF